MFLLFVDSAGLRSLGDGFQKMRVDHWILPRIPDDSYWVQTLLYASDLAHHHFPQHNDASIRGGQSFACTIGDGPLSLPSHVILSLYRIHAELGIRMQRLGRVLVRLYIFHRWFVILYD